MIIAVFFLSFYFMYLLENLDILDLSFMNNINTEKIKRKVCCKLKDQQINNQKMIQFQILKIFKNKLKVQKKVLINKNNKIKLKRY